MKAEVFPSAICLMWVSHGTVLFLITRRPRLTEALSRTPMTSEAEKRRQL